MKNGTKKKEKHEIGDLVIKRMISRKGTNYIIGIIVEHRIKYNNRSSAYPWGVCWTNQEIITRNGYSYYTAGEITRYKNILKEYIEKNG